MIFDNRKIFLLLSFSLLINSCSFNKKISEYVGRELCSVSIDFKNELSYSTSIEFFNFNEHVKKLFCKMDQPIKKYSLEVEFTEEVKPLILQENSDILRKTTEVITNYKLIEISSSKELFKGKFRLISSYNSLFSPYLSDLEDKNTKINLYRSVADELRIKLINFFYGKEISLPKKQFL